MFRAADVVKHHPSGERWVLAVDQDGEEVMPCGWPQTFARAEDCTLEEAASDEQRNEMLARVAVMRTDFGGYDRRKSLARKQLGGAP